MAVPHAKFKKMIWAYYKAYKRPMPWRDIRDPYKIVVSEVMLQQTQVSRVMTKYPEFIRQFPNFKSLAAASPAHILKAWQGMGYNRRALALKKLSEAVRGKYKGRIPNDPEELKKLPSIGKATAGSIAAFAFNNPVAFIETNIRRVYIHFFFPFASTVRDEQIIKLVQETVDKKNAREWYYALMDYGAMLGKQVENPNKKSTRYKTQPKFEGSNRQTRGKIIAFLLAREQASAEKIAKETKSSLDQVKENLLRLKKEGLLNVAGKQWRCAER